MKLRKSLTLMLSAVIAAASLAGTMTSEVYASETKNVWVVSKVVTTYSGYNEKSVYTYNYNKDGFMTGYKGTYGGNFVES